MGIQPSLASLCFKSCNRILLEYPRFVFVKSMIQRYNYIIQHVLVNFAEVFIPVSAKWTKVLTNHDIARLITFLLSGYLRFRFMWPFCIHSIILFIESLKFFHHEWKYCFCSNPSWMRRSIFLIFQCKITSIGLLEGVWCILSSSQM